MGNGLNRITFLFTIFITLAIIVFACSDSGEDPQDKEFVLPDTNLTYKDHIGPLFAAKCATPGGCHDAIDHEGGLNFSNVTTYPDIMTHIVRTQLGDHNLVIPGSSDNSFLYQILLDDFPGIRRMPVGGPPFLNANNLNGVRIWIDDDAAVFE